MTSQEQNPKNLIEIQFGGITSQWTYSMGGLPHIVILKEEIFLDFGNRDLFKMVYWNKKAPESCNNPPSPLVIKVDLNNWVWVQPAKLSHPFFSPKPGTMIKLSRRARSMLSLGLNSLALCFAVSAFCTSYWCEGTHKVVKPPCLSAVKKGNCVPVNSNVTMDGNVTMDPHVVQYIWETGEDKYAFRYFHTGFWLSCEEHHGGTKAVCNSEY